MCLLLIRVRNLNLIGPLAAEDGETLVSIPAHCGRRSTQWEVQVHPLQLEPLARQHHWEQQADKEERSTDWSMGSSAVTYPV